MLDRGGLAFDEPPPHLAFPDEDVDPVAVLRNRHPFRGVGMAAGLRPVHPVAPVSAPPPLVVGLDPFFARRVADAGAWLPDAAVLFDQERSDYLWGRVRVGYAYEKEVRRQAKGSVTQDPGMLELTACVDYCLFIVKYSGDLVQTTSVRQGGPYYLELSRRYSIDAARTNVGPGYGRWANDADRVHRVPNCELVRGRSGRTAVLRAVRDIDEGEEILVSYHV